MKFTISRNKLSSNPYQLARKAGYGFIRDRRSGQESLVRRLGGGHYPRFHLYIEEDTDQVTFSLHLDKQESAHPSQHRHNAEYNSEEVAGELETLKKFISSQGTKQEDPFTKKSNEEEKKSWLKRLFN